MPRVAKLVLDGILGVTSVGNAIEAIKDSSNVGLSIALGLIAFGHRHFMEFERVPQEDVGKRVGRARGNDRRLICQQPPCFTEGQRAGVIDMSVGEKHCVDLAGCESGEVGIGGGMALFEPTVDEVVAILGCKMISTPADFTGTTAWNEVHQSVSRLTGGVVTR